ncbi:amyloid protein-binding protein 2-like [Acanthaster planci]|uniref:Amyloid protein-binding protein 2-like n=1 Tax=Acanthaster planci TaxID=133434 RepID=A0A8B7YKS6_ACAPL|nr:amyloid protein-binding protein 2-like [Acanthaster planci]
MAVASELEWVPETLYNSAITAVVSTYSRHRLELRSLPENIQFDVYYKLYKQGRLCQLGMEFCELDVFAKVLRANDKRHLLHHCLQALMDHGVKVASVLADSYATQATLLRVEQTSSMEKAIQLAFSLGKLAYLLNLAALHGEMCALLFAKSQYDEAYNHCVQALKGINNNIPVRCIVHILRQAAKACVVKREFKKAELLIKHAIFLVREHFGTRHPKYSDILLDFGFYLLNIDSISQSTVVYQQALDIRLSAFGGRNLHVAIAHEDLAYASYVHQYSSGKFDDAREHAEKAISIITQILPENHLLLASSRRVKALILEEIAIDSHDKDTEGKLLQEAHDLHLSSLNLAKTAFGEFNVQTAKHYGNLGRLYQSMHRYKEAEEMHKKAITIKERLLGEEDYEVALSVGHLASLYNYDMKQYKEAEELYLRSIDIGKKLFGPGYSGLEYDYRGLIRLYINTSEFEKMNDYNEVLGRWKLLRESSPSPVNIVDYLANYKSDLTTEQVIQKFFKQD